MNPVSYSNKDCSRGFSLIEVMLALLLVASAIVTIMALVPVGLRSSRDAANSIILGHILEDAHERLEGHLLKDGDLDSDPIYYDSEGIYVLPPDSELDHSKDHKEATKVDTENREEGIDSGLQRRLYRVDIRLVSPFEETIKTNAPDLKAVILNVGWPVDPMTGELPVNPGRRNRKSITYYVNALTGPGWSEVDPDFKPLIEF